MNATELKKLAEAASKYGNHVHTHPLNSDNWRANEAFQKAANPAAILKLLAINAELVDALKDSQQTLSWLAFGECRNITDRPLKTALQAEESAKAALAKAEGGEL